MPICPNCRITISKGELWCSGACREEWRKKNGDTSDGGCLEVPVMCLSFFCFLGILGLCLTFFIKKHPDPSMQITQQNNFYLVAGGTVLSGVLAFFLNRLMESCRRK
jgi:hypothetical protein